MRVLVVLLHLVALSGCSAADTSIEPAGKEALESMQLYRALDPSHRLVLAPPSEPGIPLTIMGRLVRLEDGSPIAGASISIFQADSRGAYNERVAGDETTARLSGKVVTDQSGRFLLRTVLPGDYGESENNRHIHMSVSGADPEAYDFYFLQRINRGLLSWARQNDQAILISLQSLADGSLLAQSDVPVKRFE